MLNKVSNLFKAKASTTKVVLVFLFAVVFVFFALTTWLMNLSKQTVTEVQITEHTCYFTENEFTLRWMHSVEKQYWEDNYQTRDNDLLLTTTYFQSFGAGTPSTEKMAKIQKPGYVGYRIDEVIPELHWAVSRLTMGEIRYANHQIPIHLWAPDYSNVIITPQSYNIIDRFIKDKCHDYRYE